MVFSGDVSENSSSVRSFVKRAIADFLYLESKVFVLHVDGEDVKVEFKLCELPNDMKMLCFLGGELSNAATYFTTFANVHKDDCRDPKKTFGKEWKPFSYAKRISDGLKVRKKVEEVEKSKLADTTKRQKITTFIKSLNSRQYEEPLVKHFINLTKCDSLHLKNNVCKELFVNCWKAIHESFPTAVKYKLYKQLPESNIFFKFVRFVHKEMRLNKLSGKMIAWFNETKHGFGDDFHFRFRGQESNALLKYFPKLILQFLPLVTSEGGKQFLLRYFYQILNIRKLISNAVRLGDFIVSGRYNDFRW